MKPTLRPLRTEQAAEWDRILFSILRKYPEHRTVKKVENFLTLLPNLATAETYDHRRFSVVFGGVPETPQQEADRELHYTLKRYRSSISNYFDKVDKALEEDFVPVNMVDRFVNWHYAIVRKLLDLSKEPGNKLSLFRRCQRAECRGWFYAAANRQVFCGAGCRKQLHSQSDEFKAKRASYMKNVYRPDQKRREAEALKLP